MIAHLAEEYVSFCMLQFGRTTRDQRLHLLPQRNADEFEQARRAQRSQLLGGLCKSDVHRGTRKNLQDGPLHAQLAALCNVPEPKNALGSPSLIQRLHPPVVREHPCQAQSHVSDLQSSPKTSPEFKVCRQEGGTTRETKL